MRDVQTKDVTVAGKRFRLPVVFRFRLPGDSPTTARFYDVKEYRPPKAGEFFISGAYPEVYRATQDIRMPYLIAVPGERAVAKTETTWTKEV